MDRPRLVLLCGLLCDDFVWDDVARRVGHAADITIMSFPGFSAIGDMAQHVLDHAPPRFALAGHSMGGRVALEVIRRAPDRVTALALLNTGATPGALHEVESRGRLVHLAQTEGMARLAAEWLPPMLSRTARHDTLLHALTAMVERNTAESYASQIRALLNRPDGRPVLPQIRVPTLLASGTNDTWSPLAQHAAMQQHIALARLVAIEDAGHMSPVEQPHAVADAMLAWLTWADVVAAQAAGLSDTERMVIEHACARQIRRYAGFIDASDFAAATALFTVDGELARPSDPDTLIAGRADILREFLHRPARFARHIVSNTVVEVLTPTLAFADSSMVVVQGDTTAQPALPQTISIGMFHDVFAKAGDQWLFARRRGSIAMRRTAGASS